MMKKPQVIVALFCAFVGSGMLAVQVQAQPTRPITGRDSSRSDRRAVAAGERVNPDSLDESALIELALRETTSGVLLGRLDALSKPEAVEKLATFSRLYFDALIKKGFSREEALKIVIGANAAIEPRSEQHGSIPLRPTDPPR